MQTTTVSPLHAEPRPDAPGPLPISPVPPAPSHGRRPFLILGGALAAVLALMGVYLFLTAGEESTDDAQIEADVVPVAARVGGAVAKVAVRENEVVKAGQLLLKLDDADYAARVKQAEAELATEIAQAATADAQVKVVVANATGGRTSAQAAFAGSSAGVSNADAQAAAAEAGVVRAKAEVQRTKLDLKRANELRAGDAVPQQQVDNAQAAFDSAEAALAQAEAQLTAARESERLAKTRVGEANGRLTQSATTDAQIAAARAQADLAHARVQSALAQLDLAKLQLSYTSVTAATGGVVSKLAAHEGMLISQNQTIAELVPGETYVVANFKETQIGAMKPGDPAHIKVDAFSGRAFEGRVESLSGGTGARFSLLPADNASGNFVKVVQRVPVRLGWVGPPPQVPFRAGLSASVTVVTK